MERRWRPLREERADPAIPARDEETVLNDTEGGGGFVNLFKFFPNFFFGSDEEEERGCVELIWIERLFIGVPIDGTCIETKLVC